MSCFERVQHGVGYKVEGLELRQANCGCGGMTGPGGSGTGDCCFTFSRVKQDGNTLMYFGKKTTPSTSNNYEWGYKVKKNNHVVEVKMLDTRGPVSFKFGGVEPPPLSAWQQKGWEVVSQFDRPVEGTGEPLPEWCNSPESACERPDIALQSPHGTKR
jgi:hypothetical protein